jgi:hypothetical protein
MTDYLDAVRSINHAYWAHLLEHDAQAIEIARQQAQQLGLSQEAVENILNEFSRQPLQEWLTRRATVG